MNPPRLLRPPLLWLVIAEALFVTALGAGAWHLWQDRRQPATAAVANPMPVRSYAPGRASRVRTPAPFAPTSVPIATPSIAPQSGPTPGLRTDPEFLAQQMDQLNRVENSFENLEWRVTNALVDATQYYVKRVVLPAIDRSEQAQR